MWRKSIHVAYGLFDSTFKSSGDREMWIRAACIGSSQFAGVAEPLGLFYSNPQGLSTKQNTLRFVENERINSMYIHGTKSSERFLEFLPKE